MSYGLSRATAARAVAATRFSPVRDHFIRPEPRQVNGANARRANQPAATTPPSGEKRERSARVDLTPFDSRRVRAVAHELWSVS
jgi:hypothetical protein